MSNIKIAFSSNEKFARHLAAFIASILSNSLDNESFDFYILDGGITEQSQEKIRSLNSIKDFNVHFLKTDFEQLKDCPNNVIFTKNAYSRLLLDLVLPDVDRILYLDCDMIATRSLGALWESDLKGKSLGVVHDFSIDLDRFDNVLTVFLLELTFKDIFNSGLLLMNLDKIRKEKTFRKTLEWVANHPSMLQWADQNPLNVVFHNDFVFLDGMWNGSAQKKDHLNGEPMPAIIHYLKRVKPWHLEYDGLYEEQYEKYLSMTPWKGTPKSPQSPVKMSFIRNAKRRLADWIAQKALPHSPWLQSLMDYRDSMEEQNKNLFNVIRKRVQ
ncbi:MAG: glycosyltransferase family 8 protein [Thermoguttaceae bacterium]|nr:glycosyltransferase family 8 protein [Thermoguttaceae bacterium]